MNKKFENVPIENDTLVVFEKLHNIGEFEVLYQIWRWQDYIANSIIFLSKDVEHLREEEIIELVKNDPVFKGPPKTTFKRNESGYIFVNFNFELDEPSFSVDLEKIPNMLKGGKMRSGKGKKLTKTKDKSR